MKDTVIVIAEQEEKKLAEQFFPNAEVLITGVGAINIIRSLQHLPRTTRIINIGYAGSANFEVGTWVEVSEARLNHPNVSYPEPKLMLEPLGESPLKPNTEFLKAVCFSGVDFVLASKERDCVFDMELAFICALGFEHVSSIKYVSDNLSLHEYREVGAGVEQTK